MVCYKVNKPLKANLNTLHNYKANAEGKENTTNNRDKSPAYYTSTKNSK